MIERTGGTVTLGRPSAPPRAARGHDVVGNSISLTAWATISRVTEKLDVELERFARRPLEEEYPYLILDARYEKVR